MGRLFFHPFTEDDPPSTAEMTPQLMIVRPNTSEQRYINYKHRFERQLRDRTVLKHQYFQLLTDLNTVIAYYRYSWETRDYKADLHNLRLRDSMSDADVTVAP